MAGELQVAAPGNRTVSGRVFVYDVSELASYDPQGPSKRPPAPRLLCDIWYSNIFSDFGTYIDQVKQRL